MKVLVVGSIPPPPVGHRQALLKAVLQLRQEGHDVEIVSLDPLAAAHCYLAAPGLAAAVEVGLLARRAGALVVQIEPGLPVRRTAGKAERTAALVVLAAALRSNENVTVRLQQPTDLPGGTGGRAARELWKAANRIEVGDEAMRSDLARILGPLGDRVSVALTSAPWFEDQGTGPTSSAPGGWGEGADTTAAQVQAVVRARAAAQRESLATRGRLSVAGGSAPPLAQWQWLPSPGAGVPDLGPVRVRAKPGRRAGRRMAGGRGHVSARSHPVRRAATSILAAAERRPLTRPAAHLARLVFVELRAVVRPGPDQEAEPLS